ncbi:TetR/AcrR family transcriptional regulator [Nocardia terpenica]|uniref:TetR/AcrR family transcriptional regulator n=1 Tax=Nocardia terpenica TaxID=455432 RepID=UPI001892E191|nr:TetR/AcrR family transcriptional regulator [Nocardia terpenica]MBF6064157.1 TetR/AcrR family transcriptional regulator [Nocardia terpenica]MBF6106490.1 TetR/AcrR family transcriptional regulator [Nocardia terpenica]MBF6113775.1 TetR/AcrR family transcriptional regulator [Nocardia terpenica]MBF6120601.1 TetR/AcrR family transcriptional regulator [Nocardia terpenica]MBF6154742.1 TetR/AcrR family transcriptional regulator [Nocardia terpenica]
MTRPMRRDAARNRDRLLREAAGVFTEQGLTGSLEEIARRAGVSIGTLYNHFPTRDALIDELVPARLAELDDLAARAAAEPDAWRACAGFVDALLTRLTADRGLREAFTGDHPAAAQAAAACERGMMHLSAVLDRARTAGALRADATDADVAHLIWMLSQLGEDAARRRAQKFVLDGLRPR